MAVLGTTSSGEPLREGVDAGVDLVVPAQRIYPGLQVFFHGSHADLSRRLRVTDFVQSLQWEHSTTAPWESMSLTLKAPAARLRDLLPGPRLDSLWRTRTGFWVVVMLDGNALAWGRVSSISWRQRVGSAGNASTPVTEPVSLRCESWFSTLQKSRIVLAAPGTLRPMDGFVYEGKGWGEAWKALLTGAKDTPPGELLRTVHPILNKIRVPDTLAPSSGTFGDAVGIVYDGPSAQKHAPDRFDEIAPVPGWAYNALGTRLPSGTAGALLMQTFSADPDMVEFFPALAPLPNEADELSNNLGARPVIVYRLRPWIRTSGAVTSPVLDDPAVSPQSVQLGRVEDVQWSYSDERVNAVRADAPLAETTPFYGAWEKPVFDGTSIPDHGLRLEEPSWPFLPDLDGTALADYVGAINELAWLLLGRREQYASGSATVRFIPQLQAGRWVAFDDLTGMRWQAYAESVNHDVAVSPTNGTPRARTTIRFVRAYPTGLCPQRSPEVVQGGATSESATFPPASLGLAVNPLFNAIAPAAAADYLARNVPVPSFLRAGAGLVRKGLAPAAAAADKWRQIAWGSEPPPDVEVFSEQEAEEEE